jgi:hypothetical protein
VNLRATGVLAALTLAVAAFVYFVELGDEGPVPPAGLLFGGLSETGVEAITIERPDAPRVRTVRMPASDAALESGGWRVVEPVSAPGDPVVLDRIARSLSELVSGGRVEDPVDLGVYGLDAAATRVAFVHEGRERTLALGRETPLGGQVYALVPGDDGAAEIHMLDLESVLPFDVDLNQVRDARVLAFAPDAITRIRLAARGALAQAASNGAAPDAEPSTGGGGFEATLARDSGTWSIVAPAALDADVEAVERLLSDLSLLRAEAFVDEPTEAELASLDPPVFVAVVEDGSESRRLELGVPLEDAPHLRLARGREGRFYRVRGALVEHFPDRLVELRDRRVLRFSPSAVVAIEVGGAGRETQRLNAVPALLETLSRLRADEVVAEALGPAELEALQLEPARLRVRLLGAADALLAELRLGRATTGAESERGLVARSAARETVWRVDAAIESLLSEEAIDKLLTDEKPAAVSGADP